MIVLHSERLLSTLFPLLLHNWEMLMSPCKLVTFKKMSPQMKLDHLPVEAEDKTESEWKANKLLEISFPYSCCRCEVVVIPFRQPVSEEGIP